MAFMTSTRLVAAWLAIVLVAACTAQPSSGDSAPAGDIDARPARPSTATPRIFGSCCGTGDSTIMESIRRFEDTPPDKRPPELAMLHYRFTSGLDQPGQIVVRDSATWVRLWPEIGRNHSPAAPLPAVDFSREMLVIASMGSRSSGGYAIWVENATVANDTLRIALREQSPGPRCGTPAMLTAPVALARMERTDLPITFMTTRGTSHCP
jgi:hypothetical protein